MPGFNRGPDRWPVDPRWRKTRHKKRPASRRVHNDEGRRGVLVEKQHAGVLAPAAAMLLLLTGGLLYMGSGALARAPEPKPITQPESIVPMPAELELEAGTYALFLGYPSLGRSYRSYGERESSMPRFRVEGGAWEPISPELRREHGLVNENAAGVLYTEGGSVSAHVIRGRGDRDTEDVMSVARIEHSRVDIPPSNLAMRYFSVICGIAGVGLVVIWIGKQYDREQRPAYELREAAQSDTRPTGRAR